MRMNHKLFIYFAQLTQCIFHTLHNFYLQTIIIVTNTWWVLCYSSDLDLLWQKQLMDFKEKFQTYHIKSMGALITSHTVRRTDEGMVIVGGSFAHTAHKEEKEDTG